MKTLCIAEKNNIAVNVLDYVRRKYSGFEVIAVMNKNESYHNSWQRSFGLYCLEHNIRIAELEDVYGIKDMLFLSVEFDRIIIPSKFESHNLFNIHFSLLPKYKGCNTSIIPILNDETESGVTLHRIRRGIDTGEIIAQRKVDILHDDTSLDLYLKLIDAGSSLAAEYLERLINNNFTEMPQSYIHSDYYSRSEIDYANIQLDLNKTAWQIHNQIRAFAFRPYQLIHFRDSALTGSRITSDISHGRPGTVLEETDTHFLVSTIDYDICMYKDVLNEIISAILEHDNERAKSLCEFSRIIYETDKKGDSPVSIAERENNSEMIEFFAGFALDNSKLNCYNKLTAHRLNLSFYTHINRKNYAFSRKKRKKFLERVFCIYNQEELECTCAS